MLKNEFTCFFKYKHTYIHSHNMHVCGGLSHVSTFCKYVWVSWYYLCKYITVYERRHKCVSLCIKCTENWKERNKIRLMFSREKNSELHLLINGRAISLRSLVSFICNFLYSFLISLSLSLSLLHTHSHIHTHIHSLNLVLLFFSLLNLLP